MASAKTGKKAMNKLYSLSAWARAYMDAEGGVYGVKLTGYRYKDSETNERDYRDIWLPIDEDHPYKLKRIPGEKDRYKLIVELQIPEDQIIKRRANAGSDEKEDDDE